MNADARYRLFRAGFGAIAASGADRWLAPAARGVGVILAFHHVRPAPPRRPASVPDTVPDAASASDFAPNALLAITPDFLAHVLVTLAARGFEVVPLDAVPGRLAAPGGHPFAALTFDDGYRDNRDHAWPVLRRFGVPWTLFVTTDFADGAGRLWWVELEEAVRRLDRVVLPRRGLDLPSRTGAEKQAAFALAYRILRAGPEPAMLGDIADLARAAGFSAERLPGDLCLTWDEIADLAAEEPALTVGAHTLSHPMLAKHEEGRAREEVFGSRVRLEERLGQPVRHLAYPVGDPGSAGGREFALAREAGYATAVTTRPGHLFPGHRDHLHALPRVSVNGLFQTDAALRALLSGVPFLAWNRGRRLNVA